VVINANDSRATLTAASMSADDFGRLRKFIYSHCGINIGDSKKVMLETRLQRRLKQLKLPSFSEYCHYLFSPEGMEAELTDMINHVTTNKTDFFREPGHFEYLKATVIPALRAKRSEIIVWSAGCSSGEEPYTISMVLKEGGCNFTVLATDISTNVLEKAKTAVYDEDKVAALPPDMRQKYLLVSKDRSRKLYRIVPELRGHVRFRRLNFMDGDFGFREAVDVIFCRNVIIYFDKPTQERLLNRISACLSPDGYLFMGHSETLFGMDVPLVQVAPTIYRKNR
jgi:chemotaxis protein methyltransferase CheR